MLFCLNFVYISYSCSGKSNILSKMRDYYLLQVNRMLETLDENVFGPVINFREYSFLENPRLPIQV